MANWLFWAIAAALALASLGAVFAPLLSRAGPGQCRSSYDMQVLRDQLREIEADRARGTLSAAEAEATRIEISRRLLGAAAAEAREDPAVPAPRRLSGRTAGAAIAVLLVGAGALYGALGAPGLGDEPLRVRLAREAAARAERPGQAEAEAAMAARAPAPEAPAGEDAALVARLEAVLKERPDDLEGHRLLARSLGALGRLSEARAAQERVLAILGDRATAQDLVDLAEISIFAAGGYVSPEAEAALARALALAPANPVGRYYSGLALAQGGRPDLAYRVWSGLLAEGPPDAPWIAPIRAEIGEVARMAGLPAPAEAPGAPAGGPSPSEIEAARDLPPEERQAMVEGMVAELARRLATQGGPPEDWARLIRSLGVLGRADEGRAILAEARAAHGDDAAALATIDAAAREAGLLR